MTTITHAGIASLRNLAGWVWGEFYDYGRNVGAETYTLSRDGMDLRLTRTGGVVSVVVYASPHVTRAQPAACKAEAGDLDLPDPAGIPCYTLPAHWFLMEDNR